VKLLVELLAIVEPHCVPPAVTIPGAKRREESLHAQHSAVLAKINVPVVSYDWHAERFKVSAAQLCQSGFMLYAKHMSEFNIMMSLFDDLSITCH
jgi:hypothetical protein